MKECFQKNNKSKDKLSTCERYILYCFIIIILINHACIAHITFREKSLCTLRMKNTEGSKVKMG